MNIRRFILKTKDATLSDYLSVFSMLVGLLISPFYRSKYKNVWAICERKDEARDNGYHFFKYMAKEHPQQKCVYAINKNCHDYEKVRNFGEIIQFGSVKHWIAYFNCKYLISSQGFKPNGYVCAFIERSGLFYPYHVFLQHGITINRPEYLLPSMTRLKYFITTTPQETDFVINELGYGANSVKMCGFPRFDALHDTAPNGRRIIIMPTWRKWLRFQSETHEDAKMDIQSSEYISMWRTFLCDEKLKELAENNDLEIIFYPHPNMLGIIESSAFVPSYIKVVDIENSDIQEIMKSSQLLITDYSSVFFDMVYMKRPVIFYQFDIEKFRKYHYKQGWFDYSNTNFGKSFATPEAVIAELKRLVASNFTVDSAYLEEFRETFPMYDTDNSERVYFFLKNR